MKKRHDELLTNEFLARKCSDQFEVVKRAIGIAEYLIRSGKSENGKWSDKIAYAVLQKMTDEGPDLLEQEVLDSETE